MSMLEGDGWVGESAGELIDWFGSRLKYLPDDLM
jgi:hypothetical protein